jgi:hypothetical protein
MVRGKSRIAAAGVLCGLASPALAVPTFFVLQTDTRFIQTGPSTTVSDGFDFIAQAAPNDFASPMDFDGGTVSFPASSPIATSPLGPIGVSLEYQSGKILNQATFQTDYPASGTYTFHMTDSTNAAHTQTQAVDNSVGTPVTTTPALTAASFSGLQGLDVTHPFTVNFNSFANPSPAALIFLAVQDSLGNTPVFDGLQPNVTQDVIPANTLSPGTSYNFFLFFENVGSTTNTQVTFDNRTSGSFTTAAVPEPASAATLGLVTLTCLTGRRRRQRRGG